MSLPFNVNMKSGPSPYGPMQSVITPQVVHGVPKPPLGFSQGRFAIPRVSRLPSPCATTFEGHIGNHRYPISATTPEHDLARLGKLDDERAALVVDPHHLVAVREQRSRKAILVL